VLTVSLHDGRMAEAGAACAGFEHGVNHQGQVLVRVEARGCLCAEVIDPTRHRFDGLDAAQQARLDGARGQVLSQCLKLSLQRI